MSVWTTPLTWVTSRVVTAADLNAQLSANLNYLYRVAVRKSANESVTSSTTMQNDDELLFAIAASETWTFEFVVLYEAATAGDLSLTVTGPSGSTVRWGTIGLSASAVSDPDDVLVGGDQGSGSGTVGAAGGGLGAGTVLMAIVKGSILNGVTAGTVNLQWAQSSSSGTATIVHLGSTLLANRIAGG